MCHNELRKNRRAWLAFYQGVKMKKAIGAFIFVLFITTTYLAVGFTKMSAENAKLTKMLLDKEEDYNWLERELYATKKQLDKVAREQDNLPSDIAVNNLNTTHVVSGPNSKKATQTQKMLSKQKTAKQLLDSERLTSNGQRL